ncbi:antibiotic biosynthesis monooxygenase [Sulfitobacter mediterraneus]|uniref:putative quinol monooxygenase n=1 Tax=Sulfitobacter mediterraneus TaxID=83219 RepID=UPI0019334511|nr:putative quinol monooxygenase [Sulfitobacter mediterraneus]MBM1635085.1 antibiotic biosynthesis monooxygenase [Sulfitobacter mediterraneus]MBM1642909.1 antibiotic biosynthesis monooxygenase [Sulfitobacter mediterraneus]MBM1646957.1 antibiotic biosynthesis monooxygenase [Sulfitobacter mediterraneus]MBM1650999.1 antibiotic biosynthesis monooxygenase [Sulfitobacter mediterraneus]MBM1655100.1 antibiotic biosynthesis monooxygenase [Sulfitobacter mediterraneus]
MTDKRIIIATITAHSGHEGYVAERIERLAALTRQESGCLRYEVYRDPTNAAVTLIYEVWSSHADWRHHVATDHLQAFKKEVLTDRGSMQVEILRHDSEP